MVESFRPDLMFLDWRLPHVDGLAATRRIRARQDIEQPRIIILTANVIDGSRQEALAAGADDFMGKPFDEDQFYRRIEAQLDLRFIREEVAGGAGDVSVEVTASELSRLTSAVRENLVRAALALDPAQVAVALAGVEREDPALAARLGPLAEAMDYHRLWQVLGIADSEQG